MTEETNMPKTTYVRPGLVTFAALMMIIVGGMSIVTAIEEFSNAAWLSDISFGLFGKQFVTWAIIDLIIGIIAIVAGIDIWRGGNVGRWIGIILAAISATRWFFMIWWVPIAAGIVITIDVIIIYGLTSRSEYFDQ